MQLRWHIFVMMSVIYCYFKPFFQHVLIICLYFLITEVINVINYVSIVMSVV